MYQLSIVMSAIIIQRTYIYFTDTPITPTTKTDLSCSSSDFFKFYNKTLMWQSSKQNLQTAILNAN